MCVCTVSMAAYPHSLLHLEEVDVGERGIGKVGELMVWMDKGRVTF